MANPVGVIQSEALANAAQHGPHSGRPRGVVTAEALVNAIFNSVVTE